MGNLGEGFLGEQVQATHAGFNFDPIVIRQEYPLAPTTDGDEVFLARDVRIEKRNVCARLFPKERNHKFKIVAWKGRDRKLHVSAAFR